MISLVVVFLLLSTALPQVQSCSQTYQVQSGDTGNAIASANGISFATLESLNPGVNWNNLQIGQSLCVANSTSGGGGGCTSTYAVRSGDTGNSIAAAHGISFTTLEGLNPGVNWNNLQIGQSLCVGGSSGGGGGGGGGGSGGVVGLWYWTWSSSAHVSGENLGIAFSGWVNPSDVLGNLGSTASKLVGSKYISFGGGNSNGNWNSGVLTNITNAINGGSFNGWAGLAFDVEQGNSGLESNFATAFQAAKNKGFKVLVTVSHSAPYGISDASTLMNSFFNNSNIDYLSPQLYSSGTESSNDYSTSGGVAWSKYKGAKAKIIPSIVEASYYGSAQSYFSGQGITLGGFVQWAQS